MNEMRLVVPKVFTERLANSRLSLERLSATLNALGIIDDRHPLLTIYATGSLGRGEVGNHSDLDVFLVDTADAGERIGNLARIRLLSDLMRAADSAGFGEFSNDGEFLRVHPLADLRTYLGTRDDDATNVFTARMLLLLESEWLVGEEPYWTGVDGVLGDYWRDCKTPEGFLPYFLINDLVRYWKTLCLNYEANRADLSSPRDPEAVARRRLALVKLRFNRLWMCFNGLAYLVSGYQRLDDRTGCITRDHARTMVALSPLDRLSRAVELVPDAYPSAQQALYELGWWLAESDRPKGDLTSLIAEDAFYREARARGEAFGNAMGDMLDAVAAPTILRRQLLL